MIEASGFEKLEGLVTLSSLDNETYEINAQTFDKVILACGAWLGQTLEPLVLKWMFDPKRVNYEIISLRV